MGDSFRDAVRANAEALARKAAGTPVSRYDAQAVSELRAIRALMLEILFELKTKDKR